MTRQRKRSWRFASTPASCSLKSARCKNSAFCRRCPPTATRCPQSTTPRGPACSTNTALEMKRPAQRLFAIVAIIAPLATAAAAGAAESVTESGVIATPSNPCLMAKYGHGRPCQVPPLPEASDISQLIAAHLARAQFFIDIAELPEALG